MGLETLKRYAKLQKQQAQNVIETLYNESEKNSFYNFDYKTKGMSDEFLEEAIIIHQRETLKRLQRKINESEGIKIQIKKDIEESASQEKIINDCLKCISILTDDSAFYDVNITNYNKKKEVDNI